MTVWYYSKWNEIFVRGTHTMWTVSGGCTCTVKIEDIRSWKHFTFLGDL